ncbi:sensor histidine kinase [Rhodocaloribacter sp.]
MKKFFGSLYGKISLVYLVLLLVLGVILIAVTGRSYMRFTQEVDQKLNRTLAQNLAQEFSPYLKDQLDYDAVGNTMHYLMVMNPRVEIYLLDREGRVLAFFADQEKVVRRQVRLGPITHFLSGSGDEMLLGDDPRSLDRVKPFSVAPITYGGGQQGYLYVILGGEAYDSTAGMVRDSAIARITFVGVVVILAFTALVGLVLFFFLTRRFRVMIEGVRRFEAGDLAQRIPVTSEDEIGQLARAFNQMADTLERSMAELKNTDNLRRELIANVSHDLRSPLASIQGYVETILMKDAALTPEERTRFLDIIHDTTTGLSKLVNELFELSKLDALQIRPKPEPCSLAELTQDVVMKFKPRAEQLEVELKAMLPPQLPMVRADIGMMERVLSNLIENALQYTPEHGTVHVGLKRENGCVRVFVSDTGYGIPEEEIPFLCERFYRVDKSRARASGGAGLGLAIAQKILSLHDSALVIESTVNVGTTVSFDLAAGNGRPRTPREAAGAPA